MLSDQPNKDDVRERGNGKSSVEIGNDKFHKHFFYFSRQNGNWIIFYSSKNINRYLFVIFLECGIWYNKNMLEWIELWNESNSSIQSDVKTKGFSSFYSFSEQWNYQIHNGSEKKSDETHQRLNM